MVFKSTCRQYLASLSCSLSTAMTAACFVWLTPLMPRLIRADSEIPMTTTDISWIVASVEFGELVSPIPAGILANRWGRKPWLLSTGPLCIISWILVLTTRSMPVIYLVRIIQGIAVGIVYTIAPMYVAEISDPTKRGELSCHFQTMWYVGVLYAFCVGPFFSYQNYAYICAIIPFLFLATFIYMPESPYYLIMVKKGDKAKEALQWLRASKDVKEELSSIQQSVEEDMQQKGSWKDLVATKGDRRSLLAVQSVCVIKYMIGMPAVTSYATQTFSQSSEGFLTPDQLTMLMGGILLVSTFVASYVIDAIGRRPLLIMSTVGSLIFNAFIGLYYFLDHETETDVSDYVWVMYLSLAGYCIVCSFGLGPILQTIQAEYFPSHTRGLGGAVTGIVGTVTTFINLKEYQMVEDQFGVYMNFWIFGFFAFVGSFVLCALLPETKGKSLGQIQTDMKKSNAPPKSVPTETCCPTEICNGINPSAALRLP